MPRPRRGSGVFCTARSGGRPPVGAARPAARDGHGYSTRGEHRQLAWQPALGRTGGCPAGGGPPSAHAPPPPGGRWIPASLLGPRLALARGRPPRPRPPPWRPGQRGWDSDSGEAARPPPSRGRLSSPRRDLHGAGGGGRRRQRRPCAHARSGRRCGAHGHGWPPRVPSVSGDTAGTGWDPPIVARCPRWSSPRATTASTRRGSLEWPFLGGARRARTLSPLRAVASTRRAPLFFSSPLQPCARCGVPVDAGAPQRSACRP